MVPHFATTARPPSRLTGKVPWRWGELEQKAFDTLKSITCARPSVAAPDYTKKLYLDTDASEIGHGYMLYQYQDDKKQPIPFGSQAWKTPSMLARPMYYKEGLAMFKAIDACRYYIESSPFTTVVRTDHKPLMWVKHTHRGPLTTWLVEKCAGLDYTIEYIRGEDNICADAFSRTPFIQRPLASEGVTDILGNLLKNASDTFKTTAVVWSWADRHTNEVARAVQEWRLKSNPVLKMAPTPGAYEQKWSAAILMPTGDAAPGICAKLLRSERPAACLCPSDLVNWISLAESKAVPLQRDDLVHERLERCKKIVMLNTGLTWIVHEPANGQERQHVVLAVEVKTPQSDHDRTHAVWTTVQATLMPRSRSTRRMWAMFVATGLANS